MITEIELFDGIQDNPDYQYFIRFNAYDKRLRYNLTCHLILSSDLSIRTPQQQADMLINFYNNSIRSTWIDESKKFIEFITRERNKNDNM